MTLLPVVERELRVAARLPGTHWIRLVAALVALAIGGWIMLIPGVHRTPGTLGIALFVAISIIVNLHAFLGLLRTADCLSEEKREGTLGLLFLTDLKGFDIVLGKLAATSLHTFYGMLAVFPIMAISLLVGGVSGGEFWRVVLVSIVNLFFSLSVGMFCSAVSRDERKAVVLGLVLVAFFVGGLPLIGAIAQEAARAPIPNPIFLIPSPGYATFIAFDATARNFANFNFYQASVICEALLGLLFLVLACFIVPRTWHDKVQRGSGDRRRSMREELKFGSTIGRVRRRIHFLALNPFFWLTSRDRMKSWMVWMFLGLVALFWMYGLMFDPHEWRDEAAYVFTAFVMHIVLKFWVAGEACRRFCLDRQSGALELLLSTPMSVPEILQGQFMSLRRQFGPPVVVVICADLLFLAGSNDSEASLTWLAGISMLIADLITLSWVGMWLGLNSRNSTRAAAMAIARILFLPWLVFLATVTAWAVFSTFFNRFVPRGGFDSKTGIAIWMVFGFANNVIFGLWAARNLQTQFRLAATRRFETSVRRMPKGNA
jgi:ABC-type transport system involved in multi-copper enzyme maturation permease subunit